jgi:transposase-like protein
MSYGWYNTFRKEGIHMTRKKEYTEEYKQRVLEKLMPPIGKSVPEVAKEEGINRNTLYGWVAKARDKGAKIPNSSPSNNRKWRNEDKMKIVLETYSMNEVELSTYCREKGLHVSDIKEWAKRMEQSFDDRVESVELTAQKQRSRQLEKELKRKEKALAEAAALLVLRKKADAIWGDPEED